MPSALRSGHRGNLTWYLAACLTGRVPNAGMGYRIYDKGLYKDCCRDPVLLHYSALGSLVSFVLTAISVTTRDVDDGNLASKIRSIMQSRRSLVEGGAGLSAHRST